MAEVYGECVSVFCRGMGDAFCREVGDGYGLGSSVKTAEYQIHTHTKYRERKREKRNHGLSGYCPFLFFSFFNS